MFKNDNSYVILKHNGDDQAHLVWVDKNKLCLTLDDDSLHTYIT